MRFFECHEFSVPRMQAHFDALSERLAEGFAKLPEEQGMAEIEVTIREEREAE
jgi:hypothetical protein